MRACACLWGGTYNPIIPVFKKPPKEWKPEIYERFKGPAIATRAEYMRLVNLLENRNKSRDEISLMAEQAVRAA